MLIVSIVSSTFAVPMATAEYVSPTATKSTYVPPNMVGTVTTTQNTGNLDWVPYNNDVLAPVAGGPWGRLVVADYNGDGYLDFTITGNGYGEKGTWRFYGNPDSHNPESPNYMVMGERRKISDYYWTEDYGRCVYDDNGNYLYTTSAAYTYVDYDVATNEGMVGIAAATNHIVNPLYIEGDKIIDGRTIENNDPASPKRLSSSNQMRLVDFNGDGLDDIVYGLDEWGTDAHESGAFKIPKYSNSGLWGDNNGDGVVNKADPDHDLNGDGKIV